jgi:hypothetical protein
LAALEAIGLPTIQPAAISAVKTTRRIARGLLCPNHFMMRTSLRSVREAASTASLHTIVSIGQAACELAHMRWTGLLCPSQMMRTVGRRNGFSAPHTASASAMTKSSCTVWENASVNTVPPALCFAVKPSSSLTSDGSAGIPAAIFQPARLQRQLHALKPAGPLARGYRGGCELRRRSRR